MSQMSLISSQQALIRSRSTSLQLPANRGAPNGQIWQVDMPTN